MTREKKIKNEKKKKVRKAFSILGYKFEFGLKKLEQGSKEERQTIKRLKGINIREPIKPTEGNKLTPLTDSDLNDLEQLVLANKLLSEGKTMDTKTAKQLNENKEKFTKRPTFETHERNPFKKIEDKTCKGQGYIKRPASKIKRKEFIFSKTIEKDIYTKMKAMNTSDSFIEKWQFSRFLTSAVILLFTLIAIAVFKMKPTMFAAGVVISIVFYAIKGHSVKGYYTRYKFNRNLEFSKFARLVVPYLRQAKGGVSMYHIFGQMVNRLENPIDRHLLQRLMIQITDRPNDIEPYIEFAENMSGTDFSVTFMSLLYDISQGATDDNIVDNLGKEVSSQLMDVIKDIVEFKERKFSNFPTAIVAPNMILIIGYMICTMIYQFAKLKF